MDYNEYVDQMVKFQRDLNDKMEEGGHEYRLVHIPPLDLIPYEHMGSVTKLSNYLAAEREDMTDDEMNAFLIGDEADIIDMALTVYKSVLLAVHGNRFREEIRKAREEAKKKKEAGE